MDLFTSYLTNRSQVVKINSIVTKYGIPQGITLEPVIIIIYVNSLLNLKINGSIILYANDIVILIKEKSENELYKFYISYQNIVITWLVYNMLQLNLNKSIFMHFHLSNATHNFTKSLIIHKFYYLKLDNNISCTIIQNVSLIKYLGVIVDEKF